MKTKMIEILEGAWRIWTVSASHFKGAWLSFDPV